MRRSMKQPIAAACCEALEARQLLSAAPGHRILPLDPIQAKYMSAGGFLGALGSPASIELKTKYGGGTYELFTNGAIFYSPATGAHITDLPTETEFFATGSERDYTGKFVQQDIGLPTADESKVMGVAGAMFTPFQHGAIYYSKSTGAHVLAGQIYAKFVSLNGLIAVGIPSTDEINARIGVARMNVFTNGSIIWSPTYGAHFMNGATTHEYFQTSSEKDYYGKSVQTDLGLPTGDQVNTSIEGANVTPFQGGAIFYSQPTGAHVLYGAIYAKYQNINGTAVLGIPTDDETATPDTYGRFSHFANPNTSQIGAIDWTPSTGACAVRGAVATEFAATGWEKNGEAVTDEIDISNSKYFGAYNRLEGFKQFVTPFGTFWLPLHTAAVNSTGGIGTLTAGAQYTDIQQGAANVCWIDASIASIEYAAGQLESRITYEGNNTYKVALFNWNNNTIRPNGGIHADTQTVVFNGQTYAADASFNTKEPSSSWDVILQRAVIQAVAEWDHSESVQNPHSGGAGDAQAILTGRPFVFVNPNSSSEAAIASALSSGKSVVLDSLPTATTLVQDHDYAIIGVTSTNVTLYNPWGFKVVEPWSVINHDAGSIFIV